MVGLPARRGSRSGSSNSSFETNLSTEGRTDEGLEIELIVSMNDRGIKPRSFLYHLIKNFFHVHIRRFSTTFRCVVVDKVSLLDKTNNPAADCCMD